MDPKVHYFYLKEVKMTIIKKINKTICILILFLSLFLCSGCLMLSSDSNQEFDALEDALFYSFLGTDPMNVHFTLYYPENYGLEDAKVEVYQATEKDMEESYDSLREINDYLKSFNRSSLNEENRLSRDILIDYFNHKIAYDGYYYYDTQLGSYLGYQAQLPLILTEYRFDRMKDVYDYFDYLKTAKQEFENIVSFENEKANRGMGLTDVVLNRCIDQCNAFLSENENYLIPVFNEKIDEVTFLTSEEKTNIKQQNKEIIDTYFLPAYQYLKEQLEQLKGRATTNGNLASYPKGKEYYQIKLQDAIGTNQTVLEIKANLETILNQLLVTYSQNRLENTQAYQTWENSNLMKDLTLSDLIPYLKEKTSQNFPSLKHDSTYSITEINESLKDHTSPAMYFLSPLDDFKNESIFINPQDVTGSDNYTYQVIAHEGYPGHMYQHIYLKESSLSPVRKLISYDGYLEGWATYVENYVVEYQYPDEEVRKLFEATDALNYIILGLGDIGVNYEGWDIPTFTTFIQQYLDVNDEVCVDLYYDLTEVPTNYLQYYYSYFIIQDLKESFKLKMKDQYSDLLFHTIYLDTGPCSFDILKEVYDSYEI